MSPCYGVTDTLLSDVQWTALHAAPPPCLEHVKDRQASLLRSRSLHNRVSTRRAEGRAEARSGQLVTRHPVKGFRGELPGLAGHRLISNFTPFMEASCICSRFYTSGLSWMLNHIVLPPTYCV